MRAIGGKLGFDARTCSRHAYAKYIEVNRDGKLLSTFTQVATVLKHTFKVLYFTYCTFLTYCSYFLLTMSQITSQYSFDDFAFFANEYFINL